MQRDGVVPVPPSGRGERSWWLGQLVEATPLAVWPARFGGRTPRGDRRPARRRRLAARSCTPPGAGPRCGSGTRSGRARCSAPRRAPRRTGPGTASLAERSKLLATLPGARTGRRGWPSSSPRTVCRRRSSCSGVCAVPWAEPLGRVGRRRARHRPGRGQLPMELQRRHGAGRALPGPGGGGPPGGPHRPPRTSRRTRHPARAATGRRRSSAWSPRCGCARRWMRSWGRRPRRRASGAGAAGRAAGLRGPWIPPQPTGPPDRVPRETRQAGRGGRRPGWGGPGPPSAGVRLLRAGGRSRSPSRRSTPSSRPG